MKFLLFFVPHFIKLGVNKNALNKYALKSGLIVKNNLRDIDQELARMRMKTGMLLKKKQQILKQRTGLDFHNDTHIENHLNKTFSDMNLNIDYEDGIGFVIYGRSESKQAKSEHFEVIKQDKFTFKDVGGNDLIKQELLQCADLLVNYDKYAKYNVRTPKGLILEGPPGNGKTLLAKGFSGEINVGFIPVSGAQFQEKYVGVGAARVRELFDLAKENVPCIIFIDEIDAIGRKRSNDDSRQDSDSTLNEMLVNLDGFKSTNGIFLMGATNRVDLLDTALIRPGRIDKKIFVPNPDKKTRESIIQIHIKGKPFSGTNSNQFITQLIDLTNGYSGAQIENLLNEAMLYALRENRETMTIQDIELVSNRILVGFQANEHVITPDVLMQVAVHEMGHALVGMFTNKKLVKVTINLWSPTSLGFTQFEPNTSQLYIKENLMHELMTILAGRIAEEAVFRTLSTGASHDFVEAKKLAEKMIVHYGMGQKMIIPEASEHYREMIDKEIDNLITLAYHATKALILKLDPLLRDCAESLVKEHVLKQEDIENKIKNKYFYLS
jgi:cell division protease FtsH